MQPSAAEDDRERLVSAAFRLKHDVGKAVRWSAPARRERDAEALRRRLASDLARTRTVDGRTRNAAELFDAWRDEEGAAFGAAPWAERVARIAAAVDVVRARLPHLDSLDRPELDLLDDAAREIERETRDLWREVMSGNWEAVSP